MSYTVETDKNKHSVLETDTELKVFETKSKREARYVCRSLNMGSGFDGFTPNFFTKNFREDC